MEVQTDRVAHHPTPVRADQPEPDHRVVRGADGTEAERGQVARKEVTS